jgi:hypothetical protein
VAGVEHPNVSGYRDSAISLFEQAYALIIDSAEPGQILGTPIVNNNQFKICVCLAQHGINSLLKSTVRIIRRNDYAYSLRAAHGVFRQRSLGHVHLQAGIVVVVE